jgi:hypothetical protein
MLRKIILMLSMMLPMIAFLGCGPALQDIPVLKEIPSSSKWHEFAEHIVPDYPDGYTLDKRWRPLRRVQEGFFSGKAMMTIDDTLYVSDLNYVLTLQNTEQGRIELVGILMHEQLHSIRQQDDSDWFINYAADSDFRWKEEKIGWKAQLEYWRKNGLTYVPEQIAMTLNEEYGPMELLGIQIVGRMVSYNEALSWLQSLERTPVEPEPTPTPEDPILEDGTTE